YGGFVSFACHILRPWNQSRYQKLITEIPLETILIETDAPDIPLYTPEKGLSTLSRLSDLELVARQICEWKNISQETLSHSLKKAWGKLTSLE
ncbi:MAG: TatD family hydrolase, partial [Brevinematales bacterium]